MNSVGRNMPCPCMSGETYENCCEKSGNLIFFKEQHLDYFDENYAFKDLFTHDDKFRSFYLQRRELINKPVFYVKNNFRKSRASFGTVGNIGYFITTKYSQVPISESIHIAHEIEHLVLLSSGFKVVGYKSPEHNQGRIHNFFNDMIYDPKVNKELINFGFDLESYLELADEIQIGTIGDKSNNPDDLLLAMTLYVKRTLDHRNLNPQIKPEEIKFNKWIEKNYPQLIRTSKHILNIIERNGTDSPQETQKTLVRIIGYLNLNHLLEIK
jgi:hypothetical protein